MANTSWLIVVFGDNDNAGPQTGPRSTLLVNAQQSISNAIGIRFTRGMASVALAFKRRMYARFSARF
jgi:hypothetical protein